MLVLSRQRDESIMIGDNIVVTIVDIRGDKVRLGINAPSEIPVHRQEVYEAIQRENLRASRLEPGDTLYIPKGYWHHITYVTGSFSITYRIWPQNLSEWLKTSYSWLVGGTDIVLNKIPGTSAWQARRRAKAFEAKYGRPL